VLALVACGATAPAGGEAENAGNGGAVFMAGFGKKDITPKDSVPMASYGDARDRWSDGIYSKLEARAVALKDENGDLLIFCVGDVSWCPNALGSVIRDDMAGELGIPKEYIILSGTHTHASVETGLTEFNSVAKFNEQYIKGMEDAIRMAVEDLKPAKAYIGSVDTENMNFVRRYIMDDGSLVGDNAYGTGTVITHHESDADGEVQLMKFVREGGKDILISQFQAHPHLEGKTNNVSAQTVGAIRDAVEKQLDAHSLHWQGAAGNLNTNSRFDEEKLYSANDRVKYGEDMVKQYIGKVYNELTEVKTGPIKVTEMTFVGKSNHVYNHMTAEAQMVVDYFNSGHTAGETATYAHQLSAERGLDMRINSYYHANRILGNAKKGATTNLALATWSFGEVGGVVNAYEMFDTTGMFIKENSPFTRTFIVGYSYPGGGGYIPSAECFPRGGYEADNCMFAPGTAEEIADALLGLLNEQHK
jgi:hypothetical protein